jgi:type III secretion protein V
MEAVIQKNLSDFIGHQEVLNLLAAEDRTAYDQVVSSPEMLTPLTQLLNSFVAEEVPIKDLDVIFKQFTALSSDGINLTAMVEQLRSLPEILPKLPGNNEQHSFYQLGQKFEAEINESIITDHGQPFLAMEPTECQEALYAVRDVVASQTHVALLTEKSELRPFVRKLIELEFPNIPVLSRQELLPGLEDKIVGVISLPKAQHKHV